MINLKLVSKIYLIKIKSGKTSFIHGMYLSSIVVQQIMCFIQLLIL